jgi:hypothetical protein
MKLDHELIRSALLFIEENQKSDMDAVFIQDIYNGLNEEYSGEEIYYNFRRLSEAGFVNIKFYAGGFFVNSITYDGHQFLDNVRDPAIWKSTKNVIAKVSSASIPIVMQVAIQQIRTSLGI